MPDNYEEIIFEDIVVPFVLSPLHNKDIDEKSDPEKNPYHPYKKPHYHAMVMFSNVKSYAQLVKGTAEVPPILGKLNVSHVSQVHSTNAMVRYFVHADHKHKAQYDVSDITTFNGADIENLWERNDREINGNLNDMLTVIDEEDITEFADFVDRARYDMFNEWFPLITGKYAPFLIAYIRSKNWKKKEKEENNKLIKND